VSSLSPEIKIDGMGDGPSDAGGFVGDEEDAKVGKVLGVLDGPIVEVTVGL